MGTPTGSGRPSIRATERSALTEINDTTESDVIVNADGSGPIAGN